jgi:hypothetical protein
VTDKETGRPLRGRPEATSNQSTKLPSKSVAHKLQLDAERFKASRQSAAAPLTAKPPPPDPFEIGRLGPWSLLSRDPLGKRGLAICSGCQTIREIALTDGVPSCGCSASRRPETSSSASHAFHVAAHIVGLKNRART